MKALALAVGLVLLLSGCEEQLTVPGHCPELCVGGLSQVRDTVILASAESDSTFVGYTGWADLPAALEGVDGSIHVGCNVENASYGLAMCAERVAVAAAVAAGVRSFTRVAVVTDADPPAAPCGACRQVLSEFAPDAEVVAVGSRATRRWRVAELLPAAFSRDQLP